MFPRMIPYLYTLRRNLRLEPIRLKKLQQKKLSALLKHAYDNVPFYHKKFREAGIKPDDIKSIDDMSRIPFTTKFDIQSCVTEEILSKTIDIKRCVRRSTSGSTGLPLSIFVDEATVDFDGAVWLRTFLTNGLRLLDKMAVICDPRVFPKRNFFQNFGIMRRKYISIFDAAEKQYLALKQFNTGIIKGYPSSLSILSDYLQRSNTELKQRIIFSSAELLDKECRNFISSAFSCQVLDNYACHEFGLLAWECLENFGYHVNVDSVLIEFVKNGDIVAPNERGEILITSLVNRAMPLIRYSIGDVGIQLQELCPCGRTLPLMKIVEGRVDDFLTTVEGNLVSPTIFFPYPFEKMDEVKQFRVIQERKDKLIIQLVTTENFSNDLNIFRKAQKRIRKVFGNVDVDFKILEVLNRDPSGKLRKTISKIPVKLG